MWKYTFSILILFITFSSQAQQRPAATKKKDSVNFRPHELKIGLNAIRSGRTLFGSDVTTHEVEAALAMHRYVVVANYGVEEQSRGETFDYVNQGNYIRLGIDRNFSKDKTSGTVISLGLRYARAWFKDRLTYATVDQGFGEQLITLSNDKMDARWMEVVFGVRGRVVSNFFMGFNLRWQFARKVNGEGELETYDIPGFGKTRRQNSTAFDYYLMWRLPLGAK